MKTNDISSFFYYMWNAWNEEECKVAFAKSKCGYHHLWNKWENLKSRNARFGAVEEFYAELDAENQFLLVERALELYDGRKRRIEKRVESVEVFEYSQLSENAKEKAYERWRETTSYDDDDVWRSLNFIQRWFDICVTRCNVDERGYWFNFKSTKDGVDDLSGIRLYAYLSNNFSEILMDKRKYSLGNGKSRTSKIMEIETSCLVSGVWLDESFLSPIRKYLKSPNLSVSYYQLIELCLSEFFKSYMEDYADSLSEERFVEDCGFNEWRFLEDGTKV